MAEGLTITGIPVRVLLDSWVEPPMVYQGARMRMAEGNVYDGSYAGVRICECTAYFLTAADESQLRSACPRGVAVAVAGELPDPGFDGLVDIGQVAKRRLTIPGLGELLVRVVSLHIEEAEPA